jgi:hypothetical protein
MKFENHLNFNYRRDISQPCAQLGENTTMRR